MSALGIRGLSKRYGPRPVLDRVSLDVAPGEVVALLGSSGSGKTTLFRCITRLIEPDAGTVTVMGRPMQRLRGRALAEARREIGVVFQQFNLVRRRTALENAVGGRLAALPLWRVLLGRYPVPDLRAAMEALARVGLAEHAHARADQLSGGQQQRAAIARALVQRSRVLLADEPVASLDPASAAGVLGLIREIAAERGVAVLCSLHQPDLARAYADRVVTLASLGGDGADASASPAAPPAPRSAVADWG